MNPARASRHCKKPPSIHAKFTEHCSHADDIREASFYIRLSVCLFFFTISQKPTHLGSPNLTQKCSTMSPQNPFILGSKGRRSRSHGYENRHGLTKTLPVWVFALLWVLVSSSSAFFPRMLLYSITCGISPASGDTSPPDSLWRLCH